MIQAARLGNDQAVVVSGGFTASDDIRKKWHEDKHQKIDHED